MIRLALLGRPHVSGPTGLVPVPAKAMGLLAYLALHSEPQPRERVIELLWPERASLTGRKLLRNLLWRLRKDLSTEVIVTRGDRLALGETLWVDVCEFAATRELALYRGDLLDGLDVQWAAEFEDWLLSERDRCRSIGVEILDRAIARQKGIERWTEVESLARRGLSLDPGVESFHRALLEALARLGRRAEASRHYALMCRWWHEKMALEPSMETQHFYQAIMTEEIALSSAVDPTHDGATSFDYARVHDRLFLSLLSAGSGRSTVAPYGPPLTPTQHLARGWQLAGAGDLSEAQAAFQSALAGFRSAGDARAVGQAYCELAVLALYASRHAEMAEWLYAYPDVGEVGRSPALHRLRQSLIGLLEVYRSGDAELLASAARFTAEIAPALLAASRCELAHDLALRGLLDDAARNAVDRLALGQPRYARYSALVAPK